jgi:LuxR family quorum sensing-dependent transcriptional regulator
MIGLGPVDRFWGQSALDCVDAAHGAKSVAEVTTVFSRFIAEAGFHAYVMCGLPDAQSEFKQRLLADGWPAGWSEIYLRENFARWDPVERHCLTTTAPFDWCDAPYDPEREPKAREVMERACDFRMTKGFCVPIHAGEGPGAAVSLGGEDPDFGRGIRSAMYLVALFAYSRIYSLLRPTRTTWILTPREREVLQWVALGKSSWDIGVILNISERGVNKHVASAMQKLNVPNRTAAACKAYARGEIRL